MATIAIFFMGCFATIAVAQQQGQKTFSTPSEASEALFTATQNNDQKAMLDILGPNGKQLVSSGDDAEDAKSRATFRQEISGNAPAGKRAGWNRDVIYRSRELAHADSDRE